MANVRYVGRLNGKEGFATCRLRKASKQPRVYVWIIFGKDSDCVYCRARFSNDGKYVLELVLAGIVSTVAYEH